MSGNGQVTITYCTGGRHEAEFMTTILAMYNYDRFNADEPVLNPEPIVCLGGPRLHLLRTMGVRRFLEERDDEWLFSVDDDMVSAPDAIHRLLAVADPIDKPIVGGLCFGSGRSGGALFPTIFVDGPKGPTAVMDWPRGHLVECAATGWAFLLVHRSVLERMASDEAFGKNPDGTVSLLPWFVDGQVGDRLMEGDISFCARARSLGYKIHVHTGVSVGHKKPQFLDEKFFDHVRATQAALDTRLAEVEAEQKADDARANEWADRMGADWLRRYADGLERARAEIEDQDQEAS